MAVAWNLGEAWKAVFLGGPGPETGSSLNPEEGQ